jgi:hypothetical protein
MSAETCRNKSHPIENSPTHSYIFFSQHSYHIELPLRKFHQFSLLLTKTIRSRIAVLYGHSSNEEYDITTLQTEGLQALKLQTSFNNPVPSPQNATAAPLQGQRG